MLNFVICDDNIDVLNRLSKILESIIMQHDIDAKIAYTCTNPHQLLEYNKSNSIDVIFLDIDLKDKLSGIDLASKIRETNKDIYIIFTSAHLEYILIAYKCKTFDFIPKPITKERMEETVIRLMDDINGSKNTNSFIRINSKNTIINQDQVYYIEKNGMKLVFYTDTRKYETYSSFNKIIDALPNNFVRCHKSYIVNIRKIIRLDSNTNLISFDKDKKLSCSIGPKYKKKLLEVLNNEYFSNNMDSINN